MSVSEGVMGDKVAGGGGHREEAEAGDAGGGVVEGGEVWTSGRDDVGRGKLNGAGLVGTDEVDLGASWR